MKRLSISEIEQKLSAILTEEDLFLFELEKDDRKGVQACLAKWRKQKELEKALEKKFCEMTLFERKIRAQGFSFIAGVDEVGRGPLAGPVVAAAVILPENFFLAGIDDSKKLSEKKRLEYDSIIKKEAIAYSISMIKAEEIDQINIYEATKKAMSSAIASLKQAPDFLLIDAMKLRTPYPSESIIKGDAKSISIAAASIIAKTARDELMIELSKEYPAYGFQHNMGYGTKEHLLALQQFGMTPFHRKSFSPVKDLLDTSINEQISMNL